MAPPERETDQCQRKERGEQEKWGVRAKADGKNDDGPDKNQEPELNPVPS